jgi:carbon storage regulator
MLVLSRKIGEVVTVGSSVMIKVLSFDRGVVRLGIEAPKNVPVHRKEVYDKIIEMNKQASRTGVNALKTAMTGRAINFEAADGRINPQAAVIASNKEKSSD